MHKLNLKQPANGIARTMDEARQEAVKIGFPALVRPSFVLGGRAMEICYDQNNSNNLWPKHLWLLKANPY